MPIVSQAQRGLMYSAASKKGGAGGVPQSVAKEFVSSDRPGKLPERKMAKGKRGWIKKGGKAEKKADAKPEKPAFGAADKRKRLYDNPRSKA